MKEKESNMPKQATMLPPPRPTRDHDHISKRGIPYWWANEWVRDLNGTMCRIKPLKPKYGDVKLCSMSKTGNLTYIQGSIQQEFKTWHQDRAIDYILLGQDPDELLATDD